VNLPRGFLSFSSYPIHKAGDIEKEMARTISFLLAGAKKKEEERKRKIFSRWRKNSPADLSHHLYCPRILRAHVAHKIVSRPAVSIRRYFCARTRIKTNMNGSDTGGNVIRHPRPRRLKG